ncbi:proto-oncogene tyrosine-protein kinase ROS isoform X4 [Culex pipiens pallens]|uniref:proto-oncogene tyrosine-protein kinase ROS isoform X4 n=1 Tax=Culex pipiens pallens TaxID=42434 RepID=UPI0019547A69|nr:proto-oncogene tyrosine-protein kinase ROS isoform X4 [Culex pipiens pallens]
MQRILVLLVVVILAGSQSRGQSLTEVELEDDYQVATQELEQHCVHRCPDQNRTGFNEHLDASCGSDCYLAQCAVGCKLWELALESSCQNVCNKTDQDLLEPKELYCVMGCNDALNRYFRWLKSMIGTPPAPALVADSLTATSLSLEWEVPKWLVQFSHYKNHSPQSYLVQWRYEEVAGDWKFCRNQSMGDNSTIRVDNLQPYTKYRFRVALLLSPHHDEVLISEQSVIILTLAHGPPMSEPKIVRAVAVDYSRISISWEPGPFPNGPVLSYVLQIKDIDPSGYSALKDIPESNSSRYYIYEKLTPGRNYSVSVKMRNPEGEGPPSTTYVQTPPQPLDLDEDIQPTLILGAERSVLSQGSDLLSDPPTDFYRSPHHKIRGTAIHIRKNLIFVSDEAGNIVKAPLLKGAEKNRTIILTPEAGHNFKPTLLSVDWLNDHLYILGQVTVNGLWQISRCDFNGDRMTVAIAGLQRQPIHFEVDPYNGYLFWVIRTFYADAGLFRLDLGDISNGVKHEITPIQLINHHNLGAFAVEHTRFRVLVADQDSNTVLAISLDGKTIENIRNNTQSPRFKQVKAITYANELFYWTNGKEVIAEDLHKKQNLYYHNAYPFALPITYFTICANLSSAQPIPVPVNPPRNVQALLTNKKIKIFWNVPHLLGIKGKGAWQEWMYKLELVAEITGKVVAYPDITGTTFTSMDVELLKPGQEYVIKAAAYTPAGRGPWGTEFRVRTLKDSHERHLLWSGSEGIMRSDVIGDGVETLISRTELEDGVVTDIAWFESILYVVSNSSLVFYNQSESGIGKVRELESVECVTVDWIGRRLYYYNPSQQMIMRSSLHGEQHEPIHNVKNVREIKFDALRGYIYYTSEFSMEAFRLNGKDKHSYYMENDRFTGKVVIGLTLDMDNERVYWIVRSISNSELFSAHMAGTGTGKISSMVTVLSDQSPRGSLTHFSDRLLWLQHDEVVVGDLQGKNLAHIKNQKLSGARAFTIIDPAHHIYPEDVQNINVLPMKVNDSSIRIQGTWKKFSIVWDPVANVNYGKVFYKLTIKVKSRTEIHELSKTSFAFNSAGANFVPAHTEINVTISAFTYWRSSIFSSARLYSPSGKPSPPLRPRVFVKHFQNPIQNSHSIDATFRWSPPKNSNGPIIGYKVHCSYEEDDTVKHVLQGELINGTERIVPNLVHNVSYSFRVQALTSAREGDLTAAQVINTAEDHPIPQALIVTSEHVFLYDFDSQQSTNVVGTSTPINFIVRLDREGKLFWVDENNELFQFYGSSKTKLHTISGPVQSLTIDWIQRVLYWSQLESVGSAIYAFDLNRSDKEAVHLERIVYRAGNMSNLVVSPMDRKLFWTERVPEDVIFVHSFEENKTEEFFDDSFEECPNRTAGITVHPVLTLQTSVDEEARLFWAETGAFRSIGLNSKTCMNFEFEYNPEMHSVAKDGDHFYWLEKDTAFVRMDYGGSIDSEKFDEIRTLLPLRLQYYPERRCLIPLQKEQDYQVKLLQRTEDSLTLLLPKAEVHQNCTIEPSAIRYQIFYEEYRPVQTNETEDCELRNCSLVSSYDRSTTIRGLKPFTKYQFQVKLVNYYQEQIGLTQDLLESPRLGSPTVFSTAAGAPSTPENVSAVAISPTEAVVHWSPPKVKNSDRVWYEIHWQTENIHDGLKNRQQQTFVDFDETLSHLSMNLTRLQPSKAYTIWIRAYSSNTTFSESYQVNIVTFPEPEEIMLQSISSTELSVKWRPHVNISTYKLQYSAMGSKVWETVFETGVNVSSPEDDIFQVTGLQPKTQYRFIVLLFYPNRQDPYMWPSDTKFIYETEADRPSAPGRPIVTQIRQEFYRVIWEAAKDNGAPIQEYALEALVRSPRNTNRVERSAVTAAGSAELEDYGEDDMNNTIPTRVDVSSTDSEEYETFDEHWEQVYNGTEVYWFIPENRPLHKHTFRVRAKNSCGWGPYSGESEPISAPLISGQASSFLIIGVIAASSILLLIFVLICVCDVELANLRELPRRGNFIHSNNILYSSGPLTDSEIALLPQIRRDQITMTRFLGCGAFGEVYEGIVKGFGAEAETSVAIKTLRKGATEQEKAEFLQEAHLMSNFKHKHILKLIGICLEFDSLLIVMELMQGGDLLSYLRSNRPTPGVPSSLTLLDLISMCVDVATGCRYLEETHFVHRDLACRNCLVSSPDPKDRVVKIGDFGLARDIYKNDYYRKDGEGLLPVRWMSPESLVDGVYTSQSDIWAFGVLLWEIMTLGQQPYPARNNVEVLHYVRGGGRLGRPQDCPEELYQLMLKCWSYSPEDRPTFRYLLEVLKSLKERTSDSIQITSQFPCKVQNGAIFNRSYLLSDINHNPFMADIKFGSSGSGGAFIITPPTSSSGSGATVMTTTIPKYLELVYDDNHSSNSKCSTGEDVPLTTGLTVALPNCQQTMGETTDNGYEIPIHDIILRQQQSPAGSFKGRTFSSSSTVSNVSTLPASAAGTSGTHQHQPPRIDDCSSLEALLPMNSILTVRLPDEEESLPAQAPSPSVDSGAENNSISGKEQSQQQVSLPAEECKTVM